MSKSVRRFITSLMIMMNMTISIDKSYRSVVSQSDLRNLIRSKNVNGLVEMNDDELDLQWNGQ
jgi:hypothetical protein